MIRRREDFRLELGDDFRFVGRQRRLHIDQTALTRCCFTAACA
jgi:predicted nuclease of restriction endonuclease-like (RecB) superfamily